MCAEIDGAVRTSYCRFYIGGKLTPFCLIPECSPESIPKNTEPLLTTEEESVDLMEEESTVMMARPILPEPPISAI